MVESVKARDIKRKLKQVSDSVKDSFGMSDKAKEVEEEEKEEEIIEKPKRRVPKGFSDISKSIKDSWK